jgi:hypothetical protein
MSNFLKFVGGEILNLSVGYLAGMSASMLVSNFFVAKSAKNLWGLAAKREAVSKDDYDWLLFWGSYLIGLVVMLIVSYLMKRLRTGGAEAGN